MTPADPIRILILHPDPIANAGIGAALSREGDLIVKGSAATWPLPMRSGASTSEHETSIDVVVASHDLGATLAAAPQGSAATPRIVVVGGIDRAWAIRRALELGVRGYLLAGCTIDELVACVRSVHRGGRHLGPQAAARLAESVSADSLTPREEAVLLLVMDGLCNKAIARRLEIAVGTVKSHLKSAFEKLQVTSRTQAVVAAERRGLFRDQDARHPPRRSIGTAHAFAH